jgi:hypothetical protein
LLHILIVPTVRYMLEADTGSSIVHAVGDLLGKEFSTTAVTGDRIWFYTALSTFYLLRWFVGTFTANGGGPTMPGGATIFASTLHLILLQAFPLTIFSVTRGRLPAQLSQWDYLAAFLWVLAGVLQHGSELQRLLFKRQPSNKGQLHTTGLFCNARYINLTGHFLQDCHALCCMGCILRHYLSLFSI